MGDTRSNSDRPICAKTGFAFALVGDAETSTFNTDANDLAFSSDERAGVAWFVNNTNITKTGEYQSTGS